MGMVYRTPPWVMDREKLEQRAKATDANGLRPVSNLGGGRGGSLIAFTGATGAVR